MWHVRWILNKGIFVQEYIHSKHNVAVHNIFPN